MPRKKTKGGPGAEKTKAKKQAKKPLPNGADDQEDDKGVGSSSSVSAPRRGSDRQKKKQRSRKLAYDDGEDEDEEHHGGESGYESGWGSLHASDSEDGLGSWTHNDRRMVFAEINHLTEEAGKKQDGDVVFDVEGILSWRRHPRRGHPQFRAMWTGFPIYANTWEPEQNFMSEGGEIETFWQRVGGRPDDCPKPGPNDPTPSVHSDTDTEEGLACEGSVGEEARRKVIRQFRKDKVDQRKYWQWARAREKAEKEEEEAAKLLLQKNNKGKVARNSEQGTHKKRKRTSRSKSTDSDAQQATVKKRVHTIVVSDEDSDDVVTSIRPAPPQQPAAVEPAPSKPSAVPTTSQETPSNPTQSASNGSKPMPPTTTRAADPALSDDASDSMDELWNEPPGGSALPSSSPSASSSAAPTPAPVKPVTGPHSAKVAAPSAPSAPTRQKVPEQRPRPLAQASLRRLQGLGAKTSKPVQSTGTSSPTSSPREPQSAPAARRNSALISSSGPSSASATGKSSNTGSLLDLITGSATKDDSDTRRQPQARQGQPAPVPARGAYRGAHKVPNKVVMLDTPPPTTLRFNKRQAANHPDPTPAPASRRSANSTAQGEGASSSSHPRPSAGAGSSSVSSPGAASSSTPAATSGPNASAPNINGAHRPTQNSGENSTARTALESPLDPGQSYERRPGDRSSPTAASRTPLSPVHQTRFPQSTAPSGPRALRQETDHGSATEPSRNSVHLPELNRDARRPSATNGNGATPAAALPPQSYDPRRPAHASQLPPSMANGLAPPWMQRGRDPTPSSTGMPAWVARARRQQAAAQQNGSHAAPSQPSAGNDLPAHPVRPGSTRNSPAGTEHIAAPNEARNGASPSGVGEEDTNEFRGRPASPVDPRIARPKEPVRIGIKLASSSHDHPGGGSRSPRDNESPSSAPSPVEPQRAGFKSIGPPRSPEEPGEVKRPQMIPIPEVLTASHDPDRDPRKRGR